MVVALQHGMFFISFKETGTRKVFEGRDLVATVATVVDPSIIIFVIFIICMNTDRAVYELLLGEG